MSYPIEGFIRSEYSTYVASSFSHNIYLRIDWNIKYVGANGTLYYQVYYETASDNIIGNMNGELLFEFDTGDTAPVKITKVLTGSTSGGSINLVSGTISIPDNATKLYLRESNVAYEGVNKLDKTEAISGNIVCKECYIDLNTNYKKVKINYYAPGESQGNPRPTSSAGNPYGNLSDEVKYISTLDFKWFATFHKDTVAHNIVFTMVSVNIPGFTYDGGYVTLKLVLLDNDGNEVYLDSDLTEKGIITVCNEQKLTDVQEAYYLPPIPYAGYLSNGEDTQIVGFRMELDILNAKKTHIYYKSAEFFKFVNKANLATFTADSATIGDKQTFRGEFDSLVDSIRIQYQFGDLTGNAVGSGVTPSTINTFNWTVPIEFYNEMPNSKTKTCNYRLIALRNTKLLGSIKATADIYVNESVCAPVISPTITDTNEATASLTNSSSTLVRYVSNANVNAGITTFRGATVSSVIVINGSQKMDKESGTFTKVTDKDFHITVTDSRGITANKTVTVPFVEYIMPTCNIKTSRPNVGGEMSFNVSGYCYDGSFGITGGQNNFYVAYRYKPSGGEFGNWVPINTSLAGNSYSADIELTGLDYKKTYVIEAEVRDSLFSIAAVPVSSKGEPIFDWDNASMNINVPLTITQSIHVPSNGFYVEDTPIDFSSLVSVETGTWTPSMENAVIYNGNGNYIKIGNLCIINWNIQARGESAGGKIKIYGLPFSLNGATFQSGGGTISGVSIPSGHSFSGWELSNDGNIYARTMITGGSGDAGYATMIESQTYNLYASGTLMYVVQ